ncbi:CDP-glycerol glycerophosphotransferase family protein [Candidatus Protochlamydia phocaeensis]|uniref:CDP-glycerol glycerophosphotransferase family protein n=1 Tax=Candidatus Protochlamydia phocaeensis TaxID=1414722 RepID=UPI0008382D65|nr:CDP-glycerol glycerophosphotransferase family protein [Candidatus Protochlamydia phocaeensis]
MGKVDKKGIGLNPNTYIHLTEHLAPICVAMDIPLLLTDERHDEEARRLYPGLKTLLINWEDVTPHYLIEHFDVFFQSEPWHRHDFYSKFKGLEEAYHKDVRNVHVPHGFSDKIFWLEKCVWEDITLIYGENMLDLFKELGIAQHLNATVRTGNYRYAYYRMHQAFFDQIAEERVWSRFAKKQPTILYAPTCHDQEHTTSFMQAQPLFEYLPSGYNLLVKIHPALEETDGPALYQMMGKYEKKDNVVFVQDFPLVYPLLSKADLYVGDMSSIGYDFLAFNRPMFFLNQRKRDAKTDRNLFLYRCGFEIKPEQYKDFYQIMDSQLPFDQERYAAIRSEVYRYTFGEELSFDQLKKAITQAYFSPKKWD